MDEINTLKNITPQTIIENSLIKLGSDDLYIVFVDDKIKGYTCTENHARAVLEKLFNELEAEALKNSENLKVYRQNISSSEILISQQVLGKIFNGGVVPLHNVRYEKVLNIV